MTQLPGQDALDLQILRQDRQSGKWLLVGSKCPSCGTVFYPPRVLCTQDLEECTEVVLSERGTIYEAAKIEIAPVGFRAPYWVGYVDLEEGVRLWAMIDWRKDDEPRHGDRVEYEVRVVRQRHDDGVLGPVFVGPV